MDNCFAFFSGSLKTARQQTDKPNKTVQESNSKNLNGIFPYAPTRTGVDDIIRQSHLNSNNASCYNPLSCRGSSSQGSPIFPRGD